MMIRVVALFALLAALVAGAFAVDRELHLVQAPAAVEPAPVPVPVVQLPAEPQAINIAPAESKPAEIKPIVSEPIESNPIEAKPAEVKPAEAPVVAPAPSVVTAPPAPEPAPAVAAPPLPEPAPAIASPAPLPPERPAIAEPKNAKELIPAKTLFAAEKLPSLGKAMAIGYYPSGCLSGAVELPVNGPTWQVMRISRNRNWGHPDLIRFLEKFAPAAAKATGWKGILVGDLAQPRGGPTPYGHRSHQTGLDVDVWFMPMPAHTLSNEEREKISAPNVVAADWKSLNPKFWTPQHVAFIKTAAEPPNVERVLVNAAIKQELCRVAAKKREAWMAKVRPWYGHHDHIHVRLKCPADSPNCRPQPPVPGDDGCGKDALAHWFSDRVLKPKYKVGGKPPRPITLADLPPACKSVLSAPDRASN